MDFDDIIYVSILLFCIGFGNYYRKIQDKQQKKLTGTLLGLSIILAVSGIHILHLIFTFIVNALIILYSDIRKCHLYTFAFSFSYLLFFRTTYYFGIPYPPAHTNLIQMILTLKLVGLALELNSAYLTRTKKQENEKSLEEKLEDESESIENLQFVDILHYSFNYVGVLTGPYYRYRTFKDSINRPYGEYINWKESLFQRIKYVPMYIVLMHTASYLWPISYASSEEFYTDHSLLYRFWYIWPTFFIFRMRMYTGIILSECVCIMAAVGAYPTFSKPKPGQGPTEQFEKLKNLSSQEKDLERTKFNFETVKNVDPYGTEFCTTYREAMKHWNICIQYWLAVNIYKRFPSRKYRTAVTMLISSYWHGVYLGHYVCIGTAPLALLIEDVWLKIVFDNKEGKGSKIKEWIYWFFRMQMFSYQAIAFHLLSVGKIFHYYNSIFHIGELIYLSLYIVGLQILKKKKKAMKEVTASSKTEQKCAKE